MLPLWLAVSLRRLMLALLIIHSDAHALVAPRAHSSKELAAIAAQRRLPPSAVTGQQSSDTADAARRQPSAAEADSWFEKYVWNPVSGLIIGVLALVLYARWTRRVHVVFLCRKNENVISELHSLYLHRIDPIERVSPTYLTHCLATPSLCISSAKNFLRRTRKGRLPPMMHVLIVARADGEVVGLLKALYVHNVRLMLIAYVAVMPEASSVQHRAMNKMLLKLRELLSPASPVDWVAFELTQSDPAAMNAKEKLFRQYAQAHGLRAHRLAIEYVQPDLECVSTHDCHETPAFLYLASTRATRTDIPAMLVRRIVHAIMTDVYLDSWLIDHERRQQRNLEAYVNRLTEQIAGTLPERVALL